MIATFENGRYPGRRRGNHVAIFLNFTDNGFFVLEQVHGHVQRREIRLDAEKGHAGYFWDPNAYSIVLSTFSGGK